MGPGRASGSIPGGNAYGGEGRREAAVRQTLRATGITFEPDGLYYQNRHAAQIWIGKPCPRLADVSDGRWFGIDDLPDEEGLGFAIDVRTIEKWTVDNLGI